MKAIKWIEQNNYYGLDYSSKTGRFFDYAFDIRYDYCGKPEVKPENCIIWLTIYKNNNTIASYHSKSIIDLVEYSTLFMKDEQIKFLNADFNL